MPGLPKELTQTIPKHTKQGLEKTIKQKRLDDAEQGRPIQKHSPKRKRARKVGPIEAQIIKNKEIVRRGTVYMPPGI